MKPRAVQDAADRADALIASLANPEPEPAPEPTPEPTPEPQPTAEVVELPKADPPPKADPEPDSLSAQIQSLTDDVRDAKTRTSELENTIREKDRQLMALQQMVINATAAKPAAEPAAEPEPAKPLHSQADADAFGEDLVQFVVDVATRAAQDAVKAVTSDLQTIRSDVDATKSTAALTATELFERKLTELAPNWEALDEDPEFLEWLQKRPVFGNAIRAASENLDHKAAAEIFNTYTALTETPAPKTPAPDDPRVELESQVAPGRSPNLPAASRDENEPKRWALSEIQRFYSDRQNRRLQHMTADEVDQMDREIAAAQLENRVDYDR